MGWVNCPAEVLVIKPNENAARVDRADDAVPASGARRLVDDAASKVRLLRNDQMSATQLGELRD